MGLPSLLEDIVERYQRSAPGPIARRKTKHEDEKSSQLIESWAVRDEAGKLALRRFYSDRKAAWQEAEKLSETTGRPHCVIPHYTARPTATSQEGSKAKAADEKRDAQASPKPQPMGTTCPKCGCSLHAKNLERHMRRVHSRRAAVLLSGKCMYIRGSVPKERQRRR